MSDSEQGFDRKQISVSNQKMLKGEGSLEITRVTRITRKGLQSRSATPSLLIKNSQCMKEEIKLIVFLAQKSRHIFEACRRNMGA